MPLQKITLKPGVNRENTRYTSEGGYYESDKIRFRHGTPEKIGGWLKTTTEYMLGYCRQMFGWITSYNDNFLACGTNKKVYIEVGGYFYDITPLRATNPTLTTTVTDNCITTASGSGTVTIVAVGSDADVGNYVDITGANAVGGKLFHTVRTSYARVIQGYNRTQQRIYGVQITHIEVQRCIGPIRRKRSVNTVVVSALNSRQIDAYVEHHLVTKCLWRFLSENTGSQ
jgi:hypothetical protein